MIDPGTGVTFGFMGYVGIAMMACGFGGLLFTMVVLLIGGDNGDRGGGR